ncbi:hypothetical protein ACFL1E_06855 [Candidatus Omnitrophota bacterium]
MITGVAMYLACGTRSIGVVLIPTLVFGELVAFKKITKYAVIATITCVFFLVLQSVFSYSARGNLEFFSVNIKAIVFKLQMYSKIASWFWHNGYSVLISSIVFFITCVIAAAAFITRVKEKITILELFPFFYAIPIIIWPFFDGPRFLFPLIPFYLFYTLVAIQRIERTQAKVKKFVFAGTLVIFLGSYCASYAKVDFGPMQSGIGIKESQELFSFIKQNTQEQDVFIFVKPRVLSLFTGRPASVNPKVSNDTDFWKYLLSIKTSYIIVGKKFPSDIITVLPFVLKYQKFLRTVYSNDDFAVFRILWNELPLINNK